MSERFPGNPEIIFPWILLSTEKPAGTRKPESGRRKKRAADAQRRGKQTMNAIARGNEKKAQPNSATRLGAEGKSVRNRASRTAPPTRLGALPSSSKKHRQPKADHRPHHAARLLSAARGKPFDRTAKRKCPQIMGWISNEKPTARFAPPTPEDGSIPPSMQKDPFGADLHSEQKKKAFFLLGKTLGNHRSSANRESRKSRV